MTVMGIEPTEIPTVQAADQQAAQMGKPKNRIESKSIVDIVNTTYPPLMQPVEGLICEGANLFVGASKIGKSWFVLNMCMAVAAGKPFLNRPTKPGYVLYLALEDTFSSLKGRTVEIKKTLDIDLSPMFHSRTEAPTVKEGLLDSLQDWITEHQPCRMIVIDTMQMVRGEMPRSGSVYALDNEFIKPFKDLAQKNHVAIVLTHHTNKSKDTGDPFDRINGSTGLMGKADNIILLTRKRGSTDGAMHHESRVIRHIDDTVMSFDNGIWIAVSADADAYIERRQYNSDPVVHLIKDLLRDHPHGVRISYVDALRESMTRYNAYVAETPRALGVKVKKIIDDLLFFDNISVETGISLGGESKGLAIAPRLKVIENPTEQMPI